MKAILEFNLPEDEDLFYYASHASSMAFALMDFDNWLRRNLKYELGDICSNCAEVARNNLRDCVDDGNIL